MHVSQSLQDDIRGTKREKMLHAQRMKKEIVGIFFFYIEAQFLL